jgi:acetyl-CoA synthetase
MQDTNLLENQPIAWTPTPDVIERAQLTKFMRQVGVATWDELYEFSIRDVEKFTEEVLKFLDIRFDPPYEQLLDTSNGIEFPIWFTREVSPQRRRDAEKMGTETRAAGGVPSLQKPARSKGEAHAGLNIVEMCFSRRPTDEMRQSPAAIWENEAGESIALQYGELYIRVLSVSNGLLKHGISKGDAVGIHLPMSLETIIALLAINRLGAIAVPVFSGYGVEAIASRMNAVGAKAIFTCKGFTRRGKFFNARDVIVKAVEQMPTVEKVFVVDRFGEGLKREFVECATAIIDEAFERLEMFGEPDDLSQKYIGWRRLRDNRGFFDDARAKTSAEDPLIILYTSGTTGKPKGIAHTHASFPIKAAQDMAFGCDVGQGTRICWYTDIGWMMGPWLIYGALINGATICIYDGAPDYPTPDRMWEFCAKHKVEILGISPTLVRALAAHESSVLPAIAGGAVRSENAAHATAGGNDKKPPHERHDLSSLRAFASTGEPWNPAPWWWLFEKVGNSKLPIINYSGGTEIAGGILMGNPLLPQKPCSFPAPCPGMDVDILDENGRSVGPNEVGELVIKQPWIGMARGFWQEKERYLETYWSRFKNIWVHGDWAMRDADGHWFILGRSDDTLKVAGKRVGPAEVESILVSHPAVAEAAVIGVPDEQKGTAMVAFVVTSDEKRPDASLEFELKSLVARDMGKPLAPSKIHFVSAVPKTRNAKVMRRVIRAAFLGQDLGDLSSLEDPHAVDEIAELR